MQSAPDFHVFQTWRDAPSHAFGKKGQTGIVPQHDKDAYWNVYKEITSAVESAVATREDKDQFLLRPKQYSQERGSRGHCPVDLWVSVCNEGAAVLGFMPQIYIIASERGIEVGFAASIAEDDYHDPEVKARNRTAVPFINAKLPNPMGALTLDIDDELQKQGGWHFNSKTRLMPEDKGFDQFSSLQDLLSHLKQDGEDTGGGCVCRVFPLGAIGTADIRQQFQQALDNFAPLLAACSPSLWDVQVRRSQVTVEKISKNIIFDPANTVDGREKILTEVARRQGQSAFRADLLEAYEGTCAISGTRVVDVLQAAHITPYLGKQTSVVSNGILLRADIHTLFDLGLIRINPNTMCVSVSQVLSGTEYWTFHDKKIAIPKRPPSRPSPAALAAKYTET